MAVMAMTVLCMCWAGCCQANAAEIQILKRAKHITAFQLDSELPKRPISVWLRQVAGRGVKISWEVNDCGEQDGSPSGERGETPECVGLEAVLSDGREVTILIHVPPDSGDTHTGPSLFAILLQQKDRVIDVIRLRYLARILEETK
jgi:hypothetical protein